VFLFAAVAAAAGVGLSAMMYLRNTRVPNAPAAT
jgi:hypothetical protein